MTRSLKARLLLILAIVGATPMLRAQSQCTQGTPLNCVIAPATLEINLGALPVDRYWGCLNTNPKVVPSCSENVTVRSCIQGILANYRSQGATGVRFFFGLGGGGYSTPFSPSGQGLRPWLAKLNDFLADARAAGYTKVTPTPALDAPWSAGQGFYYTRTDLNACGEATSGLRFLPWLPFGYKRPVPPYGEPGKASGPDDVRFMVPQCFEINNAYKPPEEGGANWNPYFWGWDKFFRLMDYVFQKVVANNLTIADFDVSNELDLYHSTVGGRLIYDNNPTKEVYVLEGNPGDDNPYLREGIRDLMERHFPGVDAGRRVTFSTRMWNPKSPGSQIDCGSYYGDSALIINESERLAAFGHEWIGRPGDVDTTTVPGLACQGNEGGMIKLPVNYSESQPTVSNIHAYPCFENFCTSTELQHDSTLIAKNLYSDVWTYLDTRNMKTNTVMFGEVSPTHNAIPTVGPPPCPVDETYNNIRAYNNVNGFMQSTLPGSQAGPNTVLRVWYNIQEPCYAQSGLPPIKPPYGH